MSYIVRWAETQYNLAQTVFKVLIFSGARQCGKTTLMKRVLPEEGAFVSLDEASNRLFAINEPNGFLKNFDRYPCLAIDEVQKAPILFSEIKAFVDRKQSLRQYLLSGSSNYKTMASVSESMAGRLGEIRLRTLTEGEIQGNNPTFIDRILEKDFSLDMDKETCSREAILQKAMRGGFPAIINSSDEQKALWFDTYVDSLVNKDLLEIQEIRRPAQLKKLLSFCAANSSRVLNVTSCARNLDLSRITLNSYLDLLEKIFLIDCLPAWKPNGGYRVASSPKLFLCDTGLMCHLIGINQTKALTNPYDKAQTDLIGNIVETWVYQQLVTLTDINREWSMYHFRNYLGIEVDFLLENRAGDLIAIEVKASETIKSEHFKNLRAFKEAFGKTHPIQSVVLYCGKDVRRFSDDEVALPMAALWC